MPTLMLRFPGGRYHATPSGHHVNEGIVEWPPSPWRLLRALISCGYTTQRWNEGLPVVARRLVETLASTLPTYRLPPASVAHSRHFMPKGVLDKGREKTTLVFDTWADVGEGTLAVRWPCVLDAEAEALFGTLAEHLGYLGRSESWVVAEASSDSAPLPPGFEAFPHTEGRRGDRGCEQVSVMAAELPADYAQWRNESVARALEDFPIPEGKKVPKKLDDERRKAVAPYPVDIIDCLERSTAWWKQHRWSQPPGSRRVLYWRPSDALSVAPPADAARRAPRPVTTMLLSLSTGNGARSALPTRVRTLPQAELMHRALAQRLRDDERGSCPELTGKDADGAPLSGHQHGHVLPLDLDGDGHLDHIVIHAPMGLSARAQEIVRSLKRTWTKGGVGELRLAVAGQGNLSDLRRLPAPLSDGVAAVLGGVDGTKVWESLTPFVAPRYLKKSGANTLEGQVIAELASRDLPPARVEVLPWDDATRQLRHCIRVRRYPAKPPPVDAGYGLRLIFDEAVNGPISLGYGSHFGLGVFVAR